MTKDEFVQKMDALVEQAHDLFTEFMTDENKELYGSDMVHNDGKIVQLCMTASMQAHGKDKTCADVVPATLGWSCGSYQSKGMIDRHAYTWADNEEDRKLHEQ